MNYLPQDPLQNLPRVHSHDQLSDYTLISDMVSYLSEHFQDQPRLETLAAEFGLSVFDLQKLFKRWTEVSPKAFLQAISYFAARERLQGGASILDASFDVGYSAPSRLHDVFLDIEGVSPGVIKRKGQGLHLFYGWCESPFGMAVVLAQRDENSQACHDGISGWRLVCLGFADLGQEQICFEDFRKRYPFAQFTLSSELAQRFVAFIFQHRSTDNSPLKVTLIGTDFEVRVWTHLSTLPSGHVTNYSAVAQAIDSPQAARAVGRSVGNNPIAFVVPCHRVLGKNFSMTGYHWGLTRKRIMLGFERALLIK